MVRLYPLFRLEGQAVVGGVREHALVMLTDHFIVPTKRCLLNGRNTLLGLTVCHLTANVLPARGDPGKDALERSRGPGRGPRDNAQALGHEHLNARVCDCQPGQGRNRQERVHDGRAPGPYSRRYLYALAEVTSRLPCSGHVLGPDRNVLEALFLPPRRTHFFGKRVRMSLEDVIDDGASLTAHLRFAALLLRLGQVGSLLVAPEILIQVRKRDLIPG